LSRVDSVGVAITREPQSASIFEKLIVPVGWTRWSGESGDSVDFHRSTPLLS
jgi:hypothetical protein